MTNSERTTYIIEPYIGVGDYIFGAKLSEIKKKFGNPFKVETDNIMETTTELRELCSLVYEEKKLSYIEIQKNAYPVVSGIPIYEEGAIQQLMEIDANHLLGTRYINFRTLGVCVGGFSKKRIPEGRLVIAYGSHKTEFFDFYASE